MRTHADHDLMIRVTVALWLSAPTQSQLHSWPASEFRSAMRPAIATRTKTLKAMSRRVKPSSNEIENCMAY